MKALFLTILIILALAGAGSIWVWQKGEDTIPLPMVDNEPENGTPDIHTDGEVIQPRINPETGWKIFEHPYVPITFEYPGGMRVVEVWFGDTRDIYADDIVFQAQDISINISGINHDLTFLSPMIEGGFSWHFAPKIGEIPVIVNGIENRAYVSDDSPNPNQPHLYAFDFWRKPIPFAFVFGAFCTTSCQTTEMLDLLTRVVSSIQLANDPQSQQTP